MKKCPFCAEEIKEEAIKCKHCGEFFAVEAKQETVNISSVANSKEKTTQKTKKNISFWIVLIIIGVVCVIIGNKEEDKQISLEIQRYQHDNYYQLFYDYGYSAAYAGGQQEKKESREQK